MNIFVLDSCPYRAAQYHCDKHVVKMIVESAQMLCTTYHLHDRGRISVVRAVYGGKFYKKAYHKHPCTLWVGQSIHNFLWLSTMSLELCREYTVRYHKTHKSQGLLHAMHQHPPTLPYVGRTEFVMAMPNEYVSCDPVEAYRAYYVGDKYPFATWKTKAPYWWPY